MENKLIIDNPVLNVMLNDQEWGQEPRVEIISKQGDTPTEILRIYRRGADAVPTVTVHADGSATYGPDANPNEAAEIFWKALIQCPAFQAICPGFGL